MEYRVVSDADGRPVLELSLFHRTAGPAMLSRSLGAGKLGRSVSALSAVAASRRSAPRAEPFEIVAPANPVARPRAMPAAAAASPPAAPGAARRRSGQGSHAGRTRAARCGRAAWCSPCRPQVQGPRFLRLRRRHRRRGCHRRPPRHRRRRRRPRAPHPRPSPSLPTWRAASTCGPRADPLAGQPDHRNTEDGRVRFRADDQLLATLRLDQDGFRMQVGDTPGDGPLVTGDALLDEKLNELFVLYFSRMGPEIILE